MRSRTAASSRPPRARLEPVFLAIGRPLDLWYQMVPHYAPMMVPNGTTKESSHEIPLQSAEELGPPDLPRPQDHGKGHGLPLRGLRPGAPSGPREARRRA